MAVDQSFADFVIDQLSELGSFESKKMFGGLALLRNGTAFAKIKHGKVWLKTGTANREQFIEAGMPQYTYGKDNSRKLNFHETPIEILESREQFSEWAQGALQVAMEK